MIVGIVVQQYAFKASGIFVSKKLAPSGLYAADKARLAQFGWLQADQRMPLPHAEELTLGRRKPIGRIEGRQVYLSADHEDLHEAIEGDVEGCVVSEDFSKHCAPRPDPRLCAPSPPSQRWRSHPPDRTFHGAPQTEPRCSCASKGPASLPLWSGHLATL